MSQQNATIGYLPDEKPTPGKLFFYALQQVIVMPSDIKANKFYKNLGFQQYDNYTALEITNLSKLADF